MHNPLNPSSQVEELFIIYDQGCTVKGAVRSKGRTSLITGGPGQARREELRKYAFVYLWGREKCFLELGFCSKMLYPLESCPTFRSSILLPRHSILGPVYWTYQTDLLQPMGATAIISTRANLSSCVTRYTSHCSPYLDMYGAPALDPPLSLGFLMLFQCLRNPNSTPCQNVNHGAHLSR